MGNHLNDELTFEQSIRLAVELELKRARSKHPVKWNSPHEGYAIILEELDEVWDDIKRNNLYAARTEMLQVAAMALRFLEEVTPKPKDIGTTEILSEAEADPCLND